MDKKAPQGFMGMSSGTSLTSLPVYFFPLRTECDVNGRGLLVIDTSCLSSVSRFQTRFSNIRAVLPHKLMQSFPSSFFLF